MIAEKLTAISFCRYAAHFPGFAELAARATAGWAFTFVMYGLGLPLRLRSPETKKPAIRNRMRALSIWLPDPDSNQGQID